MKSKETVKMKGFTGEFEYSPIPLSKALKLNRKIERMTLNALKALESLKEPLVDFFLSEGTEATDGEIINMAKKANLEKLMEVGEQVFSTMDDEEFLQFVKDILQNTKYISSEFGAIDVTDAQYFDQIFAGNVAGIYPVLFKAMKYNNFTPFAIVGIGNVMDKIGFSSVPTQDQSTSENS
jgi:hypothetical protein